MICNKNENKITWPGLGKRILIEGKETHHNTLLYMSMWFYCRQKTVVTIFQDY